MPPPHATRTWSGPAPRRSISRPHRIRRPRGDSRAAPARHQPGAPRLRPHGGGQESIASTTATEDPGRPRAPERASDPAQRRPPGAPTVLESPGLDDRAPAAPPALASREDAADPPSRHPLGSTAAGRSRRLRPRAPDAPTASRSARTALIRRRATRAGARSRLGGVDRLRPRAGRGPGHREPRNKAADPRSRRRLLSRRAWRQQPIGPDHCSRRRRPGWSQAARAGHVLASRTDDREDSTIFTTAPTTAQGQWRAWRTPLIRRRAAGLMRALEGRASLANTAARDKRPQASPSGNARQRGCPMSTSAQGRPRSAFTAAGRSR